MINLVPAPRGRGFKGGGSALKAPPPPQAQTGFEPTRSRGSRRRWVPQDCAGSNRSANAKGGRLDPPLKPHPLGAGTTTFELPVSTKPQHRTMCSCFIPCRVFACGVCQCSLHPADQDLGRTVKNDLDRARDALLLRRPFADPGGSQLAVITVAIRGCRCCSIPIVSWIAGLLVHGKRHSQNMYVRHYVMLKTRCETMACKLM
jgi:hypothetical protein